MAYFIHLCIPNTLDSAWHIEGSNKYLLNGFLQMLEETVKVLIK